MKKITIATGILIMLVLAAISSLAQTQSREDILKQIQAKRAELEVLETRYLSPSEEDKARYADFLRQPNTGLIRLLPREKFDSTSDRKGFTLRGGGAYYSFTRLTHEYGYGSDIEFENVSSETGAAEVIAAHVPPTEEPKIRIEQRKWYNGETVDGTSYRSRAPVMINSTYLLRAIDYDRSDVLVAFRVVRVDSDDSAIILWKLVKKFPTPIASRTN